MNLNDLITYIPNISSLKDQKSLLINIVVLIFNLYDKKIESTFDK